MASLEGSSNCSPGSNLPVLALLLEQTSAKQLSHRLVIVIFKIHHEESQHRMNLAGAPARRDREQVAGGCGRRRAAGCGGTGTAGLVAARGGGPTAAPRRV